VDGRYRDAAARGKTGYVVCTSVDTEPAAEFIGAFRATFAYLGMRDGGALHVNCSEGYVPARDATAQSESCQIGAGASSVTTRRAKATAIDPVIGSFKIKFNPAHDYASDTTAGIKLKSLNLDLGSKLAFRYSAAFDILQIGGKEAGVGGFDFGSSNDFVLEIDGITGATPSSPLLRYVQTASGDSQFTTGSVALTFGSPPPATAPIPGALPLFLTAIGALGLAGYAAGWRPSGRRSKFR